MRGVNGSVYKRPEKSRDAPTGNLPFAGRAHGGVGRSCSQRWSEPSPTRAGRAVVEIRGFDEGGSEVAEVQYLVLPDNGDPYLLARVRWPDVAQAISEGRPEWQGDPGLFDLPYDPGSATVTRAQAASIAARWGANLPLETEDPAISLIRRMPANWSNLVPAEKRAWSLELVAGRHASASRTRRSRSFFGSRSRRSALECGISWCDRQRSGFRREPPFGHERQRLNGRGRRTPTPCQDARSRTGADKDRAQDGLRELGQRQRRRHALRRARRGIGPRIRRPARVAPRARRCRCRVPSQS